MANRNHFSFEVEEIERHIRNVQYPDNTDKINYVLKRNLKALFN